MTARRLVAAVLAVLLATPLVGCESLPQSPNGGTGVVIDKDVEETRIGGTPARPLYDYDHQVKIRRADKTAQWISVSFREYLRCKKGKQYPACLTRKGLTKRRSRR